MLAWIIWLVVAFILGAGEMHTRGLVLAPVAAGALVAAAASVAGLGAGASIVIFLVLSLVLLRTLRPLALRHQRLPPTLRTGPAALVGHRALVLARIANDEGVGMVKLDGECWSARSFDDGTVISAGEMVEVIAIRGAIAVVMP
jgi:membrane protein implicated in regulation of membrane protease activity